MIDHDVPWHLGTLHWPGFIQKPSGSILSSITAIGPSVWAFLLAATISFSSASTISRKARYLTQGSSSSNSQSVGSAVSDFLPVLLLFHRTLPLASRSGESTINAGIVE